jgi:lactate dehydrogenase-like 2-hydroxyacid dehydrogenase
MKPLLLVLNHNADADLARMAAHYEVLNAPDDTRRAEQIASRGGEIRAVLTIGTIGITTAEIDAMPALELICTLGVGYEKVPVEHARARGIQVSNGAGTNDSCVADHAMALLLATVRDVPRLDRFTRAGRWRTELVPPLGITGKRLGILGLGTIGKRIATRAAAFDLEIGYHSRQPRPEAPYRYFDNVRALAEWSDFLIIATPGGNDTKHLVNAEVLAALGPTGFVVNIARGSVLDTKALAEALHAGKVGGAGLDVYESEPTPPTVLFDCPNVVLTPHVAGWSPEAVDATVRLFLENSRRHFAGEALLTPVH